MNPDVGSETWDIRNMWFSNTHTWYNLEEIIGGMEWRLNLPQYPETTGVTGFLIIFFRDSPGRRKNKYVSI